MSFTHPLWLIAAVPALAFIVAVARAGRWPLGARRKRFAIGVRLALVAVLVLALAGFRVNGTGDRVAVVFLVDRSDSVGAGGQDQAARFVTDALASKRRTDLAAVVSFGREPRLELSMTDHPKLAALTAAPDPTETDLAGALRLAEGLFPEGTKRRIVVLSDGQQTLGDARAEADRLQREGIVIEPVTLQEPPADDPLIESIDAPAHVRKGEGYRLSVVVRSPGGRSRLDLYRDGAPAGSRIVDLPPGRSTIVIDEHAAAPGIHRYDARLVTAGDPVPENNRGSAAVEVLGPPRVLIVQEEAADAGPLARALAAGGMRADRARPESIPDLAGLLAYDAVALANVAATSLTHDQVQTLRAAVAEGGLGLVTVGGEHSYALGGYLGSELETLLPVESDIKDPKRRPTVAEVVVLDNSGSMAECACPGGVANGDTRLDVARAGAARALAALRPTDQAGVLAFNTGSRWVIELQKLPGAAQIRKSLAGMQANGGTEIGQAIDTAVDKLRGATAKSKHVLLFTDGISAPEPMLAAARAAAEAHVTVSIVATGDQAGSVLQDVAKIGRGRYYPGVSVGDVPQIMVQESILASRTIVNEGVFRPRITARTALTDVLTGTPSLLGYLGTTPKTAATVELSVGKESDPLLARWRLGLGTVASWTSDAKARWLRRWVSWPGYRDFWVRAVRSTFSSDRGGGVEARIVGGRVEIDVRGAHPFGPGATAPVRVLSPSLDAIDVAMDRTGPTTFRARAGAHQAGVYLVVATVRDGDQVAMQARTTASLAYSAEYLRVGSNEPLMNELARLTHGRASITPARAFDPLNLRASASHNDAWPWLATLAAFMIPVDVAVRRLIVSREDLRSLRKSLRRRARHDRTKPIEREARMDALLDAKRRATESPAGRRR